MKLERVAFKGERDFAIGRKPTAGSSGGRPRFKRFGVLVSGLALLAVACSGLNKKIVTAADQRKSNNGAICTWEDNQPVVSFAFRENLTMRGVIEGVVSAGVNRTFTFLGRYRKNEWPKIPSTAYVVSATLVEGESNGNPVVQFKIYFHLVDERVTDEQSGSAAYTMREEGITIEERLLECPRT